MNESIYTKQNDKLAIIYRKASELCYYRERIVKYIIIALSVALCLLSIVNRYSSSIFPKAKYLSNNYAQIADTLVLISGILLIFQIVVSKYSYRMHIEGVNFEERYDNYVFNLIPNKSLMRPISDANIELYASKINLPNEYFTDYYFYYFSDSTKAAEKYAQFKNYQKIFENQYRLMLNVKGFFQTVWIGFIILIFLLAASFDDTFLKTMSNILIPSLSIMSLIMAAWNNFEENMRFLQNAMNITKEMELNADEDKNSERSLNSPLLLRSLQDSLFNMRLKSFDVPRFLIRRYEKLMARLEWGDEYEFRNRRFQKKQEKIDRKIERTYQPVVTENPTITLMQKKVQRINNKKIKRTLTLEAEPLEDEMLVEIRKPVKKVPHADVKTQIIDRQENKIPEIKAPVIKNTAKNPVNNSSDKEKINNTDKQISGTNKAESKEGIKRVKIENKLPENVDEANKIHKAENKKINDINSAVKKTNPDNNLNTGDKKTKKAGTDKVEITNNQKIAGNNNPDKAVNVLNKTPVTPRPAKNNAALNESKNLLDKNKFENNNPANKDV